MTSPIICAFDTETTGKLSSDHKIIEFYGLHWQDGKKIGEYYTRINPQRTIAVEAQRVHGIAVSDLAHEPIFSAVARDIFNFLNSADIHAGHNIEEFDAPFLDQEFKACGLFMPKKPMLDSMKQGAWATPDGKIPNLGELCFATGVPYDPSKAHAADYDVLVNIEAIQRAINWGFMSVPPA